MIPLPQNHARAASQLAAEKAKDRIPEALRDQIWEIVPDPSDGFVGVKVIRYPGGTKGTVNRVIRRASGQVAHVTNGQPSQQTLTRDSDGSKVQLQDQQLVTGSSWLKESIEEAIEEYMQDHDPQQVMDDSPEGRQINHMYDQIVEGIERMFS